MNHTASAKKSSKSNGSSTKTALRVGRERQFVVCIRNSGYKASLELRKVYETIPDEQATKRHFLRIVDESGEDYLYPKTSFRSIALPQAVKKAVLAA